MKIEEIQNWEKKYAKKKGLPPQDETEAHEGLTSGFLKLSEELGELSEAILKKKDESIPEEVADIVIFACKIAKIAEDYYGQLPLTEELKKKIEYSEERELRESSQDLTKPKGGFKQWKKK